MSYECSVKNFDATTVEGYEAEARLAQAAAVDVKASSQTPTVRENMNQRQPVVKRPIEQRKT